MACFLSQPNHHVPCPANESTLVLLGHGSTMNDHSSTPTRDCAERLRERGIFHDVRTAFWKEQPHYDEVLTSIDSPSVYLVPFFISEGYFTKEIIPRAFGLTGRVTYRNGHCIQYCNPAGSHASMTRALLDQVSGALHGERIEWKSLDCILVGHGTPRNRKSTEMIKQQARRIEQLGLFARCVDAYMEEAPLIADWDLLTSSRDVVVAPFFIADGLHCGEDIPEMIGLPRTDGGGFASPAEIRGRRVWYAGAIGRQPGMVDVVLDLVREFDANEPFCSSCPHTQSGNNQSARLVSESAQSQAANH